MLTIMSNDSADVLTMHHNELQKYVQEWILQQERLLTKFGSNSQQPSEEESTSDTFEEQPSYALSTAEKQVHFSGGQHSAEERSSSKQTCNTEDSGDNLARKSSSLSLHSVMILHDELNQHDLDGVLPLQRLHNAWQSANRTQTEKWEARKNGFLQRLIHSASFEAVGMAAILANALVMTLSVDQTMRARAVSENEAFEVMEWFLSSYYVSELIFRLAAERWYFFFAPHASWNMFDLFLVCFSVHEIAMKIFVPSTSGGGNVSFFRILRICKMLKMLRILRILRSFRELRLILASMLGSMRTMFWSVVMILVINFMIALFLMQNISGYITEQAGDLEPGWDASINKYWSSITTAMTSLYMSATGGDNWSNVAEPLKIVGAPFYLCFMLYIAFFMFVVVNTMTSIFVEGAMVNAEKDHKVMMREEMKRKHEYIMLIQKLFTEMDKDGRGQITRESFAEQLSSSEMVAFLQRVGIDSLDAEGFFDILASESDSDAGGIDVEAFVLGCMKLRGAARSMDLLGLIHKNTTCHSRLHSAVSGCQDTLQTMQRQLSHLTQANEARERADWFLAKAKLDAEADEEASSTIVGC